MGGEGVAECVGVDGAHAGAAGQFLNKLPEDDARDGAAGTGGESAVGGGLGAGGFDGDERGAELLKVFVHGAKRGTADGDDAFLHAFSENADDAEIGVDVFEVEFGEFGGAQAAGVEELEDGAVADGEAMVRRDGGDEGIDLVAAEDVGELLPFVGGFEEVGGVFRRRSRPGRWRSGRTF